jgi:uncharacterized protein YdeI (YjbR/CyaY-like superfamily)
MKPDRRFLAFTDRQNWRSWLDTHHLDASEVWVVIQKKSSPDPGLFLDEAVEEALCYGWIDSTLNIRDEQSYLLRFSPRKPNSVWSMKNIHRVKLLNKEGRMMKAGLAAVKAGKDSGEWQAAIDRENPEYVPPDLEVALNQAPELWAAYRDLPDSKKKQYVYWLQSAKQKETRLERTAEILRRLRDGE